MTAAVTFDLWYTLLSLAPHDATRYIQGQEDLAVELLDSWPERASPSTPARPQGTRTAFRAEYRAAALASHYGISVSSATQIQHAASRSGKVPTPDEYVAALHRLVDEAEFRLTDGASEVLEELRDDGYRVGVVSNTVGEPGAAIERVCRRFHLDRYIEAWAWSDQHPWTKPAPELFRWCLDRLGVAASSSIHVGDGASDIDGGHRAGYRGTILYLGSANYAPEYRRMFAPAIAPGTTPPSATLLRFREIPDRVRSALPLAGKAG